MRKAITMIIIVFMSLNISAQNTIYDTNKISEEDSIKLNNVWIDFYTSLAKKDTNSIQALSLKRVKCLACVWNDSFNFETYYCSIDSFIRIALDKQIFGSRIWFAINNKSHSIHVRKIPDFQPENREPGMGEIYEDFEIFYTTWGKDEYVKGHEGASIYFTFVKVNGEFKFSGYGTIP